MNRIRIGIALLALVALLLLASVVLADAGPIDAKAAQSYELSWWTVDGGGSTSVSSEGYTLSGTIGQPDAGAASGGSYTLTGGFWAWRGEYTVFLPLVLKDY
jgi:hypothetical protein